MKNRIGSAFYGRKISIASGSEQGCQVEDFDCESSLATARYTDEATIAGGLTAGSERTRFSESVLK